MCDACVAATVWRLSRQSGWAIAHGAYSCSSIALRLQAVAPTRIERDGQAAPVYHHHICDNIVSRPGTSQKRCLRDERNVLMGPKKRPRRSRRLGWGRNELTAIPSQGDIWRTNTSTFFLLFQTSWCALIQGKGGTEKGNVRISQSVVIC